MKILILVVLVTMMSSAAWAHPSADVKRVCDRKAKTVCYLYQTTGDPAMSCLELPVEYFTQACPEVNSSTQEVSQGV